MRGDVAITLVAFVIAFAIGHPQCRDFLPPFRVAVPLKFCAEHSDLGCCTSTYDKAAKALYDRHFGSVENSQCKEIARRLICTTCSSWSQHLYDRQSVAGVSEFLNLFPALCPRFCVSFLTNCSRYILDSNLPDFNVTNYCEKLQLSRDSSYCYPFDENAIQSQLGDADTKDSNCLCLKPIARNLKNPIAAIPANDGTRRLFIVEQQGVIKIFDQAQNRMLKLPFLNLTAQVVQLGSRSDERGLLGLAFHPNYKSNGLFYVYYVLWLRKARRWEQASRVTEFRRSLVDDNRADIKSEHIIMQVPQPRANHNGGQLMFGDDGYLYVFLGDGGSAGDPFGKHGNGQNRSTLLGSILRIDVNSRPYAVPPCNPFVGERGVREEIYSYGLRNPWRCSFDRGDAETGYGRGRLFCGDVGQNQFEEIDIVEKGGNYGWRGKEGFSCYDKKLCNSMENERLPIHAYSHFVGRSVTGGYVYRGCQFPSLRGKYIYGDYQNGRLFMLEENQITGKWTNRRICLGGKDLCHSGVTGNLGSNILSFGEDDAGELYVMAVSESSPAKPLGTVFQIVDPSSRASPDECSKYRSVQVGLQNSPDKDCLGTVTPSPTPSFPTTSSPSPTPSPTPSPCSNDDGSECPCLERELLVRDYCNKSYSYQMRVLISRTKLLPNNSRLVTATLIEIFYGLDNYRSRLHKEMQYLILPSATRCRCPRFISARDYIVMGETDPYGRPVVCADSLAKLWREREWRRRIARNRQNPHCQHYYTTN